MFLENLLNSLFLRQILLFGWFLVFFSRLFTEIKLNSIGMSNSNISEDSPSVSIIVPARNEENNLEKCLSSLQQQDYPNLEFIIVDDCSIDKTRAIVKKYVKNDSRFKIVELDDEEPNIQWDAAVALAKMGDASGAFIIESLLDRQYLNAFPQVDEAEKHQAILVAIEVSSMLKDDRFETKLIALAESDQNLKVRNAAIKTLETNYDRIL